MRKTFLFPALLTFAAPAVAQPMPPLPPQFTDPATADRLANAIQGLSQALLDIRVGGVQAALEGRQATPAERQMTVRDMARRDDPDFDRKYRQNIGNVRPMVRQSMKAMNEALPAVMDSIGRAQQAIERAVANIPDPTYPRR